MMTTKKLCNAQLAGLAMLMVLVGCSSGNATHAAAPTTTAPPKPKVFTIRGTITVDPARPIGTIGKPCYADTGYDDIQPGAGVVVSNPAGIKVAVGALGQGVYSDPYTCSFPFTVPNVPDKYPLYSVEVSHRGQLTYPRAKLNSPLAFTLGD